MSAKEQKHVYSDSRAAGWLIAGGAGMSVAVQVARALDGTLVLVRVAHPLGVESVRSFRAH